MKEIWIGKKFIGDLREICIFDIETHQINYTILTEEQAKEYAIKNNFKIKYTETYKKEGNEMKKKQEQQEKQEIVKIEQTGEIEKVELSEATIDRAKKRWELYKKLESILEDDDYVWYVYKDGQRIKTDGTRATAERVAKNVGGEVKRYKKKSAFRKLGKFMNISLPSELSELKTEKIEQIGKWIVSVERGQGVEVRTWYDSENLTIKKCEVSCVVKTDTGKTYCGVAGADKDEKGWTKEQDIRATAYTRALNRAISDAIGLGEVSAEELSEEELNGQVVKGGELKIKKKIVIDDAGKVNVIEEKQEEKAEQQKQEQQQQKVEQQVEQKTEQKKVDKTIFDKIKEGYEKMKEVFPEFEQAFKYYLEVVYNIKDINEVKKLPLEKQFEVLDEIKEYYKRKAKGGI
jgi:GTP1/Obg family GTP-binding protein